MDPEGGPDVARRSRRHPVVEARHRAARHEHAIPVKVESSLAGCEVIEDYPAAHPLPDCLVLAMLDDGDPIHAVVAIDEVNERIFLVTVYRPDPARWLDERTRKPR
jgi:hypothetical protein